MLYKNARILGNEHLVDIKVEDGIITEIGQDLNSENCIDLNGKIVSSPFVEPHIHLDTTMTSGEPHYNESGTLFEGIEIWSKRKETVTIEDVKKRSKQAILMQVNNGVGFIRTHVDVTDPDLTALKALVEVREELKDIVTIQIVAFPQEGIKSFPNGAEILEQAVKAGADVIGAIPHFEYQRDWGVESIYIALDLAVKYDCLVDIHCDEIDDEQSRFLEVVAARSWELGIGSKVTVSHTTAFGSYNTAYSFKLMRALKQSGINFVANPLVNMNLGGRFDAYPKRRGLTQVKEIDAAGLNICFGHDDIYDPWYPLGNGNMLQVLHMGLHASHLLGHNEIINSLKFITTNSAKALNLEKYELEVGNPATFIVLDQTNFHHLIRDLNDVILFVKDGAVIVEKKPAETVFNIMEQFQS